MTATGRPLPALFLSHATPMLGLASVDDDSYARALRTTFSRLANATVRPRAIIAVTPEWTTQSAVEISVAKNPGLHHRFVGFPSELYRLEYPCTGAPEIAVQVAALLGEAGLTTELTSTGRVEHSAWIPLRQAIPGAEVPVISISMPLERGARGILQLGHALRPLRAEGVLLIGFGAVVYHATQIVWHGKRGEPAPRGLEFQAWALGRLLAKDVESLVGFEQGPQASFAQPKPEHFYPLLFTLGAAWLGDEVELISEQIEYSTVSTLSFALGPRVH